MLILCDSKMPSEAKAKLADYGNIFDFSTQGITYDAISGHPDIFFCTSPYGLIVSPNLPERYTGMLKNAGIPFAEGRNPVGKTYPQTAWYNALFAGNLIIHHTEFTDPAITELNPGFELLHVNQGYTRCSLLALPGNSFITSDKGIEKALEKHHFEVLYTDPSSIKLPGFAHGFFGGACGLYGKTLFLCGSLSFFSNGSVIQEYVQRSGIQIVELYDGVPMDVGTILFL